MTFTFVVFEVHGFWIHYLNNWQHEKTYHLNHRIKDTCIFKTNESKYYRVIAVFLWNRLMPINEHSSTSHLKAKKMWDFSMSSEKCLSTFLYGIQKAWCRYDYIRRIRLATRLQPVYVTNQYPTGLRAVIHLFVFRL